jgi:hypothetical protein
LSATKENKTNNKHRLSRMQTILGKPKQTCMPNI